MRLIFRLMLFCHIFIGAYTKSLVPAVTTSGSSTPHREGLRTLIALQSPARPSLLGIYTQQSLDFSRARLTVTGLNSSEQYHEPPPSLGRREAQASSSSASEASLSGGVQRTSKKRKRKATEATDNSEQVRLRKNARAKAKYADLKGTEEGERKRQRKNELARANRAALRGTKEGEKKKQISNAKSTARYAALKGTKKGEQQKRRKNEREKARYAALKGTEKGERRRKQMNKKQNKRKRASRRASGCIPRNRAQSSSSEEWDEDICISSSEGATSTSSDSRIGTGRRGRRRQIAAARRQSASPNTSPRMTPNVNQQAMSGLGAASQAINQDDASDNWLRPLDNLRQTHPYWRDPKEHSPGFPEPGRSPNPLVHTGHGVQRLSPPPLAPDLAVPANHLDPFTEAVGRLSPPPLPHDPSFEDYRSHSGS